MSEAVSPDQSENGTAGRPDRSFVLLLTPLVVVSAPSLLYCVLVLMLRLHGLSAAQIDFHVPAETVWDRVFALEVTVCRFVARWNSAATLAATVFFVSTIVQRRWRSYLALALIPYGLLLCADFTLRWR
jgi:hypothetical protein